MRILSISQQIWVGVSTGNRKTVRLFGEEKMKVLTAILGLVLFLSSSAYSAEPFPKSPQPSLTPGALCKTPSARRYPEQIAYCTRSVEGDLKDEIVHR